MTEPRLIRLPEVMRRTGLSRTTIYRLMKAGTFPKPVPLGARLNLWSAAEIEAWIDDLLN